MKYVCDTMWKIKLHNTIRNIIEDHIGVVDANKLAVNNIMRLVELEIKQLYTNTLNNIAFDLSIEESLKHNIRLILGSDNV